MEATDVIVLSPAGAWNPAPAIAACRAGARGFLDLEFGGDNSASANAIQQLARFARSGFGLKVRAGFIPPAGIRPKWIIVAGGDFTCIPKLRETGAEVLAEAVNVAEAERAVAAGADGLILKGLESGGRVGSETSYVLDPEVAATRREEELHHPVLGAGRNRRLHCGGVHRRRCPRRRARFPSPARERIAARRRGTQACRGSGRQRDADRWRMLPHIFSWSGSSRIGGVRRFGLASRRSEGRRKRAPSLRAGCGLGFSPRREWRDRQRNRSAHR